MCVCVVLCLRSRPGRELADTIFQSRARGKCAESARDERRVWTRLRSPTADCFQSSKWEPERRPSPGRSLQSPFSSSNRPSAWEKKKVLNCDSSFLSSHFKSESASLELMVTMPRLMPTHTSLLSALCSLSSLLSPFYCHHAIGLCFQWYKPHALVKRGISLKWKYDQY